MTENQLTEQHNARTLLRFAAPTIIMTLFMSLYTMVDGIFVANFISADALAGLNLVIPALSLLVALSVLISSGGSVVISRKLGEMRVTEARQDLSCIVLLTCLSGAVMTALALVFADPILRTGLGVTNILYPYALDYYRTLMAFAIPCLLQVQFQYLFVTAGAPALGLLCVAAGGISNIVLDYVLIVLCQLHIRGAALATGIGYSIPAAAGLIWFACNRRGALYFTTPRFRLCTLRESAVNGAAGMIINLAGAAVTWFYNRIIILYLGETGVSAATIVLYARFMFNLLPSGYASGVAPVISFNFGRRDFGRVKLLFHISMRAVLMGSVLIFAASTLLRGQITSLFASDNIQLASLAQRRILLFSISYLCSGVNIFAAAFFSALNRGKLSAAIMFMNVFVFLIGAMLLLPKLGLGADGVWLAVPAAELLSLLMTVLLLRRTTQDIWQHAE